MARKKRRHSAFDDLRILQPYARQSRARQGEQEENALSLDSQIEQIKSWGERMGYTVEAAIRDHDEDSETADRAGLQMLIANVRPGVTVAVELWDRLGRGWVTELIVEQIERKGGRVLSITQGSDRLSRGLYSVMGKEYLVQLSERLQSVTAQRVARGAHVGDTPFGFDRPGSVEYLNRSGEFRTRKTGALIHDPETAPVVARIFARWLAGDSLREIARTLTRDGIAAPTRDTWVPQTVAWMLRNPVYAGGVRGRGLINWQGSHAPIIARVEWDAAQLRFERSVPVRIKRDPHWCEGLIVHECGARMLLNMVSRPGGGRYPSYRCTNATRGCEHPRQHIGAPLLDIAVRQCLLADFDAVTPVDDAVALASHRAGSPAAELERVRLAELLAKKQYQYDRARLSYIEAGDPLPVWIATAKQYREEIAGIEADLTRLPHRPDVTVYAHAAASIAALRGVLTDASGDDLRSLLTTCGLVVVTERGLSINYWSPYDDLIPAPVTVDPRMRTG